MIYLDNAATTPLDADVLSRMMPYLESDFGNPSSVHSAGRDARMAVERARQVCASAVGAQAKDVIFTASATEANNLAIKGVIEGIRAKMSSEEDFPAEIVASPVEHPCVLESLRHIEKLGWAKVVWLPVDVNGVVSVDAVKAAITENTVLVCVMYVNNEIGSVQPVSEIGEVVRKSRWRRLKSEEKRPVVPIYFHCDAVQAVSYFDCDVNALGIDLLSVTGHKLYGPKGSGMLYAREGVPLVRQTDGGGQEYYKRAGTENVAAIVGLGEAMSRVNSTMNESGRLKELQKVLIKSIVRPENKVILTGHPDLRAPHITSFLFADIDGEALITALDREGFAVSSGSACSSGVVRQSHVIEALPLQQFDVRKAAALRVSASKHTTFVEIENFVSKLNETVNKLRQLGL